MAKFIHLKSRVFGLAALCLLAAPLQAAWASELGRGFIRPTSMPLEQVFEQLDRSAATPLLPLRSYALVARGSNGREYAVGAGGLAAEYFGAGGLLPRSQAGADEMLAMPALGNPYFSLVPNSSHAGISRELGGIRVKFGILRSGLAHSMALRAFDPEALSPALMTVQPRIDARVLEFSHSFEDAALSFSLMRSKERHPWPGSRRTVTAFSLGAPTSSAQLTGVWLVAPKVALAAQASYGRTTVGIDGSTVHSNAFSVGLVASDRYRIGDRFSLTLSQPIRPYRGLWVAGSGAAPNSVVPSGREVLAEMNYVAPLGPSAYGGWAVSLRRHPDNVTAAPMEKMLALRYVQQF